MSVPHDAGTGPTPQELGRFVVVPASYVYLLREAENGTEVLLQQRGDVDFMAWHWAAGAAGHVERGETAPQAAARELREELDVEADLTFEFTMQRTDRALAIDERADFFFTARSWRGEPRIVEASKCAQIGWFPLDALPEPMVPHERFALAHLGGEQRYLSFGF
ncbi:NUDIX domain-containing protein [Nocardioides yefusunii]|uniref:NUDIX domain-containing protein n=1 Tax=Nocardioides yefusunii TaxID=2500546 RepID=A0ABW1R0R7_9ACTN|nr:NUDIX domain-containing protein [Nocardioides yefusunii]